jgi:hypothetical protein
MSGSAQLLEQDIHPFFHVCPCSGGRQRVIPHNLWVGREDSMAVAVLNVSHDLSQVVVEYAGPEHGHAHVGRTVAVREWGITATLGHAVTCLLRVGEGCVLRHAYESPVFNEGILQGKDGLSLKGVAPVLAGPAREAPDGPPAPAWW